VIAIVAYWQRQQKIKAKNETQQMISSFDPKEHSVTTPPVSVPAQSWKREEETTHGVLAGHDASNQATLLRQIKDAEGQQLSHYYPTFEHRGEGFYEIEYGLMKGSGVGKPE